MNIERVIFSVDLKYNPKLINRCIFIIRNSEDENRISAFKLYIFRMMSKIVRKNIYNYQNLMRNFENPIEIENIELISECYITMDKCLEGYLLKDTGNFYFYFNVALSRKFFKWYQRDIRHQKVEITENILTTSPDLRSESKVDMMDFLMQTLNFNDTEKRIINSKLVGQKMSDFLEYNSDITPDVYARCLKRIKIILTKHKEEGNV